MPVIRIDNDVYRALQNKSVELKVPFTSPNHIIRIVLKLDTKDYNKPRNK